MIHDDHHADHKLMFLSNAPGRGREILQPQALPADRAGRGVRRQLARAEPARAREVRLLRGRRHGVLSGERMMMMIMMIMIMMMMMVMMVVIMVIVIARKRRRSSEMRMNMMRMWITKKRMLLLLALVVCSDADNAPKLGSTRRRRGCGGCCVRRTTWCASWTSRSPTSHCGASSTSCTRTLPPR
jgi:hypothetical protein